MALKESLASANYNTGSLRNRLASGRSASALYNSTFSLQGQSPATIAAEQQNNGGVLGGIGYLGEKIGLGFLQSVEGIWDYTAGGLAKLFGADDWAEQQFANDWVNYNDADEWYNPSEGWRFAGDVAGGIGTSLPAMVGVAAGSAIAYFSGGTLTPVASGIISASIAGFGAAGTATKEAYRETGELGGKEFGYGFLSGATEAGVEGLSAGLGAGTGRIVQSIAKRTAKETTEAVVKTGAKSVIKNIAKDFASEAFEEGLSEILDPVYKRMTYDPNAKAATPQEVGYAALVGGLSGAIMSGSQMAINAGVNSTANLVSGNKAVESGSVSSILDMSRQLTETEIKSDTGYDIYHVIRDSYTQLAESMKNSGGNITTVKQKMLLGQLKRANTIAVFMPFVERSAMNILANAETIAERYNEFGLQADGKKITITAEQLRSGIDLSAERKTVVKQIKKALSTNSALATLAVADATGHLTMDTKRFAEASLDGTTAARPTLASRANINSFIEQATPEQLESVSRALGIENWATITPEEFAEKVSAFEQNGGVEQYAKQGERIKELLSINEDKAKTALPTTLRVQKDSAVRYRENGVDIAVVRTGDTFQIYDYNEQVMSRVMTREEANAAMKEIRSAMQYAPSDVDIRSDVAKRIEGQTNLARETLEIDSYAKQNVPQYEELNAPSKQAVRMTIRQAQAHGIAEADTLVLAKVAAKSGLNIVFDRNIGADGMNINNTIYLNPDAAPERLRGKLLIHELDHILVKEKGGQHLITEAFLNMDAAKRNKIIERYSKFYEGKGLDAAQKIDIFTDEVASAYAEDIATDPAIWDYILSKEPTTKEKVLSFFRKSAQEYSFDDGMSTEARRYLRKFKKLFDSLSERNYQGNNTAVTEMVNPAVLHKSAETTADTEKAGRFSIQNGKVVIDTDQHIFDGVDRKDYGRTVRTYMRLHFRGKEVGGTTFTRIGESEYTNSQYSKRQYNQQNGTYEAKMRASTELDNMLRISDYIGHEDAQHPHEYNGKGYDRYSVQFEIGGENFSGELLVAIGDNDRRIFYDVVKIKRTDSPVSEASARKTDGISTRGAIGSEAGEPHTAQNRNADASTTDIISEKASDVNPSAKNTGADATKIAGNGVRYALSIGNDAVSVDVQEGKDLIAIHNLTEQNLLDTLKLGGFPMPSIAVVKAEQGHTDYGNISIVFGKDTIDPMLSSDNKIYGSDAWTPTSGNARTEYQVDGDKMRTFERRMGALSKKTAGGVFYNTSLVSRLGVDDTSSQTPLQLAEKIATTDEAKLAYLVDRGETIEPVYKEKIYNRFGNETLQTYIDTVGAEHLSSIIEKAKIEDTKAFRSEEEGVRSIIRKQYVERRYETLKNNPKLKGRDVLAFVEQQADTYMDHNVTIFTIEDFVKDAWKYYRDGKSVTTEVDRLATSDKIQQAVSDADVVAWLEPQIAEFIGRAGIYNGKDLFDAKGNRRSFAQTHYAYTAENIVRAMKSTAPARGAGAFGVSASTLVATATPSYDSIDAVRADKKRLFVEDQTAYDAAIAEIDGSLTTVEKDIMRTTSHHTDNTFDETQIIGSIIVEAATGKRTIAAVQKAFAAEGYSVTAVQAKRVLDLYTQAAEIPTGYFEAKPERVVDFSEIKMVELPQSASDTLKKQLSERNIPYEVYGTTDAERTKAVQRLDGVRFALPETDSDGNTLSEQQRRFFSESAIKAVQDDGSLRISSDGALMPVYHGTNNGEFYEFNKKLAGSSNDAGWYGKGFYFAFTKAEAEYYGKRILKCYLNIKNPFIFDSEMQSYDGVTSGDILFDFASFVLNMAEKFPDIAKKLTVDVAEYTSEDSSEVSKKNFVDLATEIKEIYNSKRLSIVEVSDELHGDHYEYRIDNDVENMDIPADLKKVIQEQYINSASWAEYLLKDGRITREQYEDILDAIEKYGETNFETIYLHSRFETRKMAESHRLSAVLQYLSEKKYGYLEQHIPEHYMERIGNEFSAEIQRRGYDGVLQSLYGDEVVAFDSSQIKLTSNTSPTDSKDIRYALPDSQTESGLSRGQRAKFVANNTQMRQYSRTDAAATIDSIVDAIGFGDQTFWMKAGLSGKSRSEVISYLFEKLNTTKEGYRAGVALKIADYIIQNATLTEVYNEAALDSDTLQTAIDTVEAIKKYKHRFNLDAIKGEIKYKYDNKAGGIFMNWAQKNGGLTADTVAQDLSDYGIHIDAVNEADIFNQIMDTYERAKSLLAEKASKIQLAEYGSEEELAKVRQDIAREILRAYDERGAETKYARLVEKYTQRIDELSSRLRESNAYNRAVNTAVDLAGKIKDWKSGAFQNATQLKPDIFKGSIEKLGAIKSRGNLNQAGTRTIIRDLLSWYKSNQSVLTDMGRYSEEIEGIMTSIATGEKVLSDTEQAKVDAVRAKCISAGISLDGLTPHEFYAKMREWYTKKNVGAEYNPATKQLLGQLANSNHLTLQDVRGLSTVLAHFKHFVENYNKVFRDGKWQDAKPYAQKYVSQMQTGKTLKTGLFRRLLSSRYAKAFNDPMSLARFMDGYEDGFFSKTMEEWRRGAIDASVTDMRLRKPIEEFYAKHKDYLKTAEAEKVTFNGVELTKREAMQLYMTLHREQAVAGIVLSGFKIRSGADSIRINGVLTNGDIITSEDIQASAASMIKALGKSLSATDKEYISVVESIYEQCRELKRQADMTRQGYTNVEDGYYVPIKRANIAHSIDADYIGESMSVSNQSFNKNTVKGAKNELIIEPIDAVLSRHIGGIAKYSSLAVAMDNFDMIYNLDISGNPNKPVTVRTESEGVWAEAESYFQNLRNDIKGKSKDTDGLNRAMQALRGGYAKAVLGLNPKVLVTQLSSFFASTSMLDYKNIARGMTIDVSDVDTYCPLAEVRNYDQTAFRAQGVLDKVGGVGNTLMKPIGAVDRFVIKRLFGACQAQIEADGGAKIGTKENKTAAGKLLERVIVETQQNSAATERSAAMRSGNEFFRTVTMFTADAMKVVGRVIDSLGETTILRAKLKVATDADVRADLTSRLKTANRKLRKSVGSLVASSVFMALVAQGFRWLYRKDDEDDNIPLNMTVGAVGNLMGGLPLVKDVYSFFADGYDISAPTYDMINSLLTSSKSVVTVCGNVVSGNGDAKETASAVKNLIFSASQFLGLPTRNAYKFVYGITNRISPETAYKIDDLFYDKNYRSDLAKAVENDDDRMTDTLLSLLGGETVGAFKSTETRDTIKRLLKSGYTVLPKSIGDSITFGGEKFELDAARKATFRQVYGEASPVVEEMVASSMFRALGEQEQAKAIKQVYDAYYEKAAHAALGVQTDNKTVILGKYMDIGKLAMSNAAVSSLESDKDKNGKTLQGSKKKKVMRYLMSQQMTDVERLLILYSLGYTLSDGEYRGWSAKNAKKRLLRFILSKSNATAEEKAYLAQMCGFTVKNGKIVALSLS